MLADRMVRPLAVTALAALAACGSGTALETAQSMHERAQACTSENGYSLNGFSLNGIATNGVATNGIATNGIATNGIATNGLSLNGIATNGLSSNGLTAAALARSAFAGWFAANGATYGDMVMRYLARCALPAGASLGYSHSGTSYSWQGNLGLAPVWASGQPIPVAEQQLITACLAAHTNKYGVHVPISVRGRQANGLDIPLATGEGSTYWAAEGCFFGNLFNGDGVYSAPSFPVSQFAGYSSVRACAAFQPGQGGCPPMQTAATSCGAICTGTQAGTDEMSNNGGYWSTCTVNGKSYRALTTYMTMQFVDHCGDGVCGLSETCSTCPGDCGACP